MSNDNKNVVLIAGPPNTGKSTSLRNLPTEEMVYLNADNKEIPFRSKFLANAPIADAEHVLAFVQEIEANPKCKGGVLDTITFLMALYERMYVVPFAGSPKGQQAWGDYGNFYRKVVHAIKTGSKNYAIMAHLETKLNEQSMRMESAVPIKGAVGKIGVEADFTTVLYSMQVPVKDLEKYQNDLLNITDEEKEDGVKYVFMTRITKEVAGSKIRAPMGLWKRNELYIDNDLNKVFTRLKEFYGK